MPLNKPYTITIPLNREDDQTLSYQISKNHKVDPNTFIYSTNVFDNSITFNELLNTKEIEKMAEQYPALQKAYKNFKQIYDIVKHDYQKKG